IPAPLTHVTGWRYRLGDTRPAVVDLEQLSGLIGCQANAQLSAAANSSNPEEVIIRESGKRRRAYFLSDDKTAANKNPTVRKSAADSLRLRARQPHTMPNRSIAAANQVG